MAARTTEVDYLVIGAGAVGMAFTDTLVTQADVTVALVDRHDKPGGHWNDAYPFVHLQQASAHYGANSQPLGSGAMDLVGLNRGMHQLASGQEVLNHFDAVLNDTLLPTGRVSHFPMSNAQFDGTITSLVSGREHRITARKIVDARYYESRVPSVEKPRFRVDDGVALIPPNELTHIASPSPAFVVIGAGKTGIDTCIWLLQHGVDPDAITWIVPRDFWIQDRANFQLGDENLVRLVTSMVNQLATVTRARTVENVFQLLEEVGELRRIDAMSDPTAYHCAVISDGEFDVLRQIKNVVRLGHVRSVERGRLHLEHGDLPTHQNAIYVNCTAQGIYRRPSRRVFSGDEIVLQWVRTCQPTFSASLIGFIEARFTDDVTKNYLCEPIPVPDVPLDWLRMLRTNLQNHSRWDEFEEVQGWLSTVRTRSFISDPAFYAADRPDVAELLCTYQDLLEPAMASLDRLLRDHEGAALD
ncbi:FAD/NAD(P)-binding protein [Microbacterium sp. X-17]|uniref:FAD/NAD(P)-binding protein n=1 Tax=Microbacterium sp. X-17 TaxID=3144404 RepID=UPI0031F5A98F